MRAKSGVFIAVASVACLCQPAIAADFAVINTANEGPGSLRQAILDANALPGADRIVFNIPGTGRHTIDVSQNFLPALTDSVTIDGYTQPGARPNTLEHGTNATILIQIDGGYSVPQYSSPRGIEVRADHCVIRGIDGYAVCCLHRRP